MTATPEKETTTSLTGKILLENEDMIGFLISHDVFGFRTTALSLRFPRPRRSLGGKDGLKKITAAANCCLTGPLQAALGDDSEAWRRYFKEVSGVIFPGVPAARQTLLCTGVDIEYIAVAEQASNDLRVTALVTAGVKTNAMRIGIDRSGAAVNHPPRAGTINIIVITNASLPVSALAASFVTATEAKIIALEEMDVRSAYNPDLRASGTGTDTVLTISGEGPRRQYVGGHTELGTIMARAVTAATKQALINTYDL